MMKRNHLSMAIAVVFCMAAGVASAQDTTGQATNPQTKEPAQRSGPSSTSNTTTSNDTKRAQQLDTVTVQAQSAVAG